MGKKINAWLGLGSAVVLAAHVCYQIVAYLTFYYNEFVTAMLGHILSVLAILHVLCSISLLIFSHDKGMGIKYGALNIRIILQRVTALLMLVLIGIHVNTFHHLADALIPLLIVQILFFACVFIHIGASVTNALITRGVIDSMEARKKIDIVVFIICTVLFIAASIVITNTDIALVKEGIV